VGLISAEHQSEISAEQYPERRDFSPAIRRAKKLGALAPEAIFRGQKPRFLNSPSSRYNRVSQFNAFDYCNRSDTETPLNLELTEEQELLQKSVRDFAEAEVKPLARENDEKGKFPRELFKKAAELGLTGVAIPEAEGGAGMDHISYAIVIEEISRACASTGVILSAQNSLYGAPIHHFGTEDQKKKFLVPFARGEKIGCFALTEPQAGSNAAALATKAVLKNGKYIINGTKAWITNGGAADAAIVYVNTQPEKGEKGITALVVEKGTPGFSVGKEEKKLGINATACTELSFSDCEVPEANRIGKEGEGYKIALATLDGGRIGIAAQAIGIAQEAFEAALAYAKQRQAFGHPIADFQAIQFMLADMSTEIDAARLLARRAAWKQDTGQRFSREAAMAKLFASEMSTRVTHKAIQIHGGYGYSREYPVERNYRDARITEIYEGTSEIQRLVIASWVLKS
jgi:butyryl-CoA dehydrogenase